MLTLKGLFLYDFLQNNRVWNVQTNFWQGNEFQDKNEYLKLRIKNAYCLSFYFGSLGAITPKLQQTTKQEIVSNIKLLWTYVYPYKILLTIIEFCVLATIKETRTFIVSLTIILLLSRFNVLLSRIQMSSKRKEWIRDKGELLYVSIRFRIYIPIKAINWPLKRLWLSTWLDLPPYTTNQTAFISSNIRAEWNTWMIKNDGYLVNWQFLWLIYV